jgi:hypothetical protein
MERVLLVEETTGARRLGGAPLVLPTEEQFDVASGPGITEVTLAATFSGGTKIEVYVNGNLQREGASHSWQRSVGPKKILFNYTVPQSAWILVRLYL